MPFASFARLWSNETIRSWTQCKGKRHERKRGERDFASTAEVNTNLEEPDVVTAGLSAVVGELDIVTAGVNAIVEERPFRAA